jgi:hypothetical protein
VKATFTEVLSVTVPKKPAGVIHTGDAIFYNLNKLTLAFQLITF